MKLQALAPQSNYPARYWHWLDDGRMQCDLCPRDCRLHEGQRGACFVRQRLGDQMVLTTYGRSSGFCVDPIEKKPLNHFYPGSSVLSFGTAGCNLACKFCQNWDISKSRDMDRLMDQATPEAIADAAARNGCKSVAFTYNDPVIFAEYAMDVADACHARGLQTVAVTAGYMHDAARRDFYAKMDAANVDLKAFTDDFYFKLTGSHLQPVRDTLVYLKHKTSVWFEITTLLIPGHNDSDAELTAMCQWLMTEL
ncbi:MAG: AmmeMemoRadiSam system radical SAM enzyme, partial [Comamonadaceae bacterium CG2_30_57_122]